MGSPTFSGIMKGSLNGHMASSNVEGAWLEDNFRKWDSALTVIRQDSYGKFLEYYPPLYIIAKFLDYLRPNFLENSAGGEDSNGNDFSVSTAREVSKVATDDSDPAKVRTPTTTKKFFKKINPFSNNSSDENKTKGSPGNGLEKPRSSALEKEAGGTKSGSRSQPQ